MLVLNTIHQSLNSNIRNYFLILVLLLIVTDLAILLDLPILRQVLSFLYFTFVPGLLILQILRLNKLAFLKKFVLSVGLSITFLMLSGLLINSCHPLISKPLSQTPILISFNIFLIILSFIAYKRNKDDFVAKEVFNFDLDLNGKLLSPMLLPFLFPLMSILGTHMMNSYGNNNILLLMLFLIPAYVVVLVCLKDRISRTTYPIAIYAIGVALVIMYQLTSGNISMGDISTEDYVFHLTANDSHWAMSEFNHNYNACLSVTILPTVYYRLTGMDSAIFMLIYPVIHALTPICAYLIFQRYMKHSHAFLASFFIIAQFPFTSMVGGTMMRAVIGLVFFYLAILVLFDNRMKKPAKRILFLTLLLSTVLSYYAVSYIFFILLLLYWLTINLVQYHRKIVSVPSFIRFTTVALIFVLIFTWYGLITSETHDDAISYTKDSVTNLANLADQTFKAGRVSLGGESHISDMITIIIHNISLMLVGIGLIVLMFKYVKQQFIPFDKGYLLLMFISGGLLITVSVLNFFGAYDPYRTFLILLIFLAPAFVIGAQVINKWFTSNSIMLIISLILVAQFFASTYMVYQLGGVHYSECLNSDGTRYNRFYVHDQEVASAKWLERTKSETESLNIWLDYPAKFIYAQFDAPKIDEYGWKDIISMTEGTRGYIYLRYPNVVKNLVYPSSSGQGKYGKEIDIVELSHIFANRHRVYSNGGSEIYRDT